MSGPTPRGVLLVGNFLSAVDGSRNMVEDLAERLRSTGVSVVCVSTHRSPWARGLDMISKPVFRRVDYSVAVVNLFSGRAFLWGFAVSTILRALQCPFILDLHGGGLPAFAHRYRRSVRWCLHGATAVVSPSGYLISQMRRYREDVGLLPNALDFGRYRYRLRERLEPNLIWVRAFHEIYNPSMAPRVLALLIKDHPDIRLTMVGPDKGDGSLARTRRVATELGVASRITFSGAVAKKDIPAWLDSADIFLNTTDIDNTPVSVMEAMASGLCIISTNVGGIPFLLSEGENALLVPSSDVESMASAVSRLLKDPGLSMRLSSTARRKAENWDWAVILPQWSRLLKTVADRNGTAAATGTLEASSEAGASRKT